MSEVDLKGADPFRTIQSFPDSDPKGPAHIFLRPCVPTQGRNREGGATPPSVPTDPLVCRGRKLSLRQRFHRTVNVTRTLKETFPIAKKLHLLQNLLRWTLF